MTTYVAFLRGINVGAHNRMKMDDLRALFESLGYDDVEGSLRDEQFEDGTWIADYRRLRFVAVRTGD